MLSIAQALDRAHNLCQAAMRGGADAADAYYYCDAATSVSIRLGKLEEVASAEGQDIGLRVFVGQRSASVSSADMETATLDVLVERCLAMARQAPEDQYAGLAPSELLLRSKAADLDLDDHSTADPAHLRRTAEEVEEAARAIDGVTNSEGGGASHGRARIALVTSAGFADGYSSSSHSLSASVIAGEGNAMQRDYAWHSAHYSADLESAEAVGTRAGERAVARLNPVHAPTGRIAVLFDPRVGGSLLSHLMSAISGSAFARKASFLVGRLDEQLFDSAIVVRDDPHRLRGLRSRAFDGEGLPTAPRDIVAAGKISGVLAESASARQLGMQPTGHATRHGAGIGVSSSNLHLAAGACSPQELMSDIAEGVYITELIGQGVNLVTGDYSRGAAGFAIRDGMLAEPIAELTIAGTLPQMFAALTPADDLQFRRGINVPTLRVDSMTVASG